jgi:hypothetical protein
MSARSEQLDLERETDAVFTLSEHYGLLEIASDGLETSNADNASSVPSGIPEAAPRRVQEDPVSDVELIGPTSTRAANGRSLFSDDPGKRLTIGNWQEIVGQRLTFSQ